MIRSREVIPAPLEHALMATRVLAALYDEDPESSVVTEGAYKEAADFLSSILSGEKFSNEPLVTERSTEYAFAYGEAMRAVGVLGKIPEMPEEVTDFVRHLISSLENLSNRKKLPPEELDPLRGFFEALQNVASGSNRKPIEYVSVSR